MDSAGVEWQVHTHNPTVRNKAYNCPELIRSCGGCPRSAPEWAGEGHGAVGAADLLCRITGTSDGNLGLQQFGELNIDWSARVVNRWPAVTQVM